jgi:hypothetical protein
MTGRNKYVKRSRNSEWKFRQLVKLFKMEMCKVEILEDCGEYFGDGVHLPYKILNNTNENGIIVCDKILSEIESNHQFVLQFIGNPPIQNINI